MTGYYLHCPFCAFQMFDDGQLAGQMVLCPHCRGQFQMPYPTLVVPPPLPEEEEYEEDEVEFDTEYLQRQRRKTSELVNEGNNWGTISRWAFAFTILMTFMTQGRHLIDGFSFSGKSREMFYNEGYQTGKEYRNRAASSDKGTEELGRMMATALLEEKMDAEDFKALRHTYERGFSDGFYRRTKKY